MGRGLDLEGAPNIPHRVNIKITKIGGEPAKVFFFLEVGGGNQGCSRRGS